MKYSSKTESNVCNNIPGTLGTKVNVNKYSCKCTTHYINTKYTYTYNCILLSTCNTLHVYKLSQYRLEIPVIVINKQNSLLISWLLCEPQRSICMLMTTTRLLLPGSTMAMITNLNFYFLTKQMSWCTNPMYANTCGDNLKNKYSNIWIKQNSMVLDFLICLLKHLNIKRYSTKAFSPKNCQ